MCDSALEADGASIVGFLVGVGALGACSHGVTYSTSIDSAHGWVHITGPCINQEPVSTVLTDIHRHTSLTITH